MVEEIDPEVNQDLGEEPETMLVLMEKPSKHVVLLEEDVNALMNNLFEEPKLPRNLFSFIYLLCFCYGYSCPCFWAF